MNIRRNRAAPKVPVGRDDQRVTDNAMKLRMLAAAGVLV